MTAALRAQLAAAITERGLQDYVVTAAQLLGWRVHHCRPGMDRSGRWSTPVQGDPGWPDLVLCRERLVVAELKREHGRVTAEQAAWIAAFRAAGVEAHVWRPSDLPRIERLLQGGAWQ
jgi:hypothetical protein